MYAHVLSYIPEWIIWCWPCAIDYWSRIAESGGATMIRNMTRGQSIVIGNAIIWAAVLLATSYVMKGTGLFDDILPILGGGAGGSLIVVSTCLKNKRED